MCGDEESKRCRCREGELKKKNAELNTLGKAESALMQTLGAARHTLANTHAVGLPVGPLRTVPGFLCIGASRWTGQLLEQRLLVAL